MCAFFMCGCVTVGVNFWVCLCVCFSELMWVFYWVCLCVTKTDLVCLWVINTLICLCVSVRVWVCRHGCENPRSNLQFCSFCTLIWNTSLLFLYKFQKILPFTREEFWMTGVKAQNRVGTSLLGSWLWLKEINEKRTMAWAFCYRKNIWPLRWN